MYHVDVLNSKNEHTSFSIRFEKINVRSQTALRIGAQSRTMTRRLETKDDRSTVLRKTGRVPLRTDAVICISREVTKMYFITFMFGTAFRGFIAKSILIRKIALLYTRRDGPGRRVRRIRATAIAMTIFRVAFDTDTP